MHNQTSHSAPQKPASNTHRPSTPEPRCVVPPPPHPRRGIRYQPPQPATPVHDSPSLVPPIPMQHVRRQRPDAQGRPEILTLLDVSDRRDVRVYLPQGPYSYSPWECDGESHKPQLVDVPARSVGYERVRPGGATSPTRGSFERVSPGEATQSPGRARLQKRKRDETPTP
ncbi:MAG: hypothetical protein Q9228_005453, partial [Teloschistes exilis]